jgi:hypothetical protein
VVIDHDHIDPGGVAMPAPRAPCAAIDGDDQAAAFARQPHQRLARRAIAFEQAVGDVVAASWPSIAQQADQQAALVAPSTS